MAKVLLFNINGSRLAKLRMLLLQAGIACRTVSPAEQGKSIGFLAGICSDPRGPLIPGSFSGEMLVMCGLSDTQFNAFLASMRANGIMIPLKAVLTDTNASWDAARLYRELSSEHEAMSLYGAGIHK